MRNVADYNLFGGIRINMAKSMPKSSKSYNKVTTCIFANQPCILSLCSLKRQILKVANYQNKQFGSR